MAYNYICSECGREYQPTPALWKCECGGLLDVAEFEVSFPLDKIKNRPATLWRYREALPFAPDYDGWRGITMGEGGTPLVPVTSQHPNVLLKMDFLMPTLSFKDRGAAVLVAKAQEIGATRLLADSSGNAGTAIAAYATRAGLECDVYVPDSASPKKLKQMRAQGANVHAIPGSREDTAAAAIAAAERGDAFYASHIFNPFFYQGTKTYAYEIWEELGDAPDVLVVPVGNGTMLLGAYYGFKELLKAGLTTRMPRFLAIQAENCAPLARAFAAGEEVAAPVANTGTVAEGIAIAAPARSRQILAAVRDTGGVITTVSEATISWALEYLARQGFYVEPTAAANYAAFSVYVAEYLVRGHDPVFQQNPYQTEPGQRIVIPLCGAGLKAS